MERGRESSLVSVSDYVSERRKTFFSWEGAGSHQEDPVTQIVVKNFFKYFSLSLSRTLFILLYFSFYVSVGFSLLFLSMHRLLLCFCTVGWCRHCLVSLSVCWVVQTLPRLSHSSFEQPQTGCVAHNTHPFNLSPEWCLQSHFRVESCTYNEWTDFTYSVLLMLVVGLCKDTPVGKAI